MVVAAKSASSVSARWTTRSLSAGHPHFHDVEAALGSVAAGHTGNAGFTIWRSTGLRRVWAATGATGESVELYSGAVSNKRSRARARSEITM